MLPPHLPPPTCNNEWHHQWRRLKILLLAVFFGLLAGVTGAFIALGWIWPDTYEGDIWAQTRARSSLSYRTLEERVRLETADRVVSVYRGALSAGAGAYLPDAQYLGAAVVVSSDGWAAMALPVSWRDYLNWKILDDNGVLLTARQAFADDYAGVLYLRLTAPNGDYQFKVAPFLERELSVGDEVFVLSSGNWHGSFLAAGGFRAGGPQLDSAAVLTFSLSQNFDAGAVAVNSQGRVAGLITNTGELLPYDYVSRALPDILAGRAARYPTLFAEGVFGEAAPLIVGGERQNGFLVTRVTADKSALRRGDIIERVNGKIVSARDFWYDIYDKDQVALTILRSGRQIELKTPVGQK